MGNKQYYCCISIFLCIFVNVRINDKLIKHFAYVTTSNKDI